MRICTMVLVLCGGCSMFSGFDDYAFVDVDSGSGGSGGFAGSAGSAGMAGAAGMAGTGAVGGTGGLSGSGAEDGGLAGMAGSGGVAAEDGGPAGAGAEDGGPAGSGGVGADDGGLAGSGGTGGSTGAHRPPELAHQCERVPCNVGIAGYAPYWSQDDPTVCLGFVVTSSGVCPGEGLVSTGFACGPPNYAYGIVDACETWLATYYPGDL